MILVCGGSADPVINSLCGQLADYGYSYRLLDLEVYPNNFRIHWTCAGLVSFKLTDLTTGAEKIYKIDIGFREDTPFGADFDSPHGNLPLRKIAGKLLQFLNFQVRETSQAITQTEQRYIVTGKVPKTASTRLDVNIGSLSLVTLGKVLPKIIFTLGTVTPAGTVSRVGDYTIGWEKPRGGASHPTPPLPSKATLNKPYGAFPPGDVFKLLELLEFKVTSFATPARGPKTTVANITCTLKSKIHCE